ncbi:MAG: nitrate reductase molybdenum cofactor assembly chaperone [Actinomycetales bacterium]|nr:nitrate reductase molybdenum cofactor assembly chaperone [Actinomycetales bacterium]
MTDQQIAGARLAASLLLAYPDEQLLAQLDSVAAVAEELPSDMGDPIRAFLIHVSGVPISSIQEHYVQVFDMKRRACPYLSYWTDGDTRNRGMAILKFKQAYLEAGYELGNEELPDHLAVVLEFAAVGNALTGDALLAEHQEAIHLLRDALAELESVYIHVLDVVIATLPELTSAVRERMAQIALSGPPVENVGLEPYGRLIDIEPIGARR